MGFWQGEAGRDGKGERNVPTVSKSWASAIIMVILVNANPNPVPRMTWYPYCACGMRRPSPVVERRPEPRQVRAVAKMSACAVKFLRVAIPPPSVVPSATPPRNGRVWTPAITLLSLFTT